ncbi:DOG1 domain-containing protein, partial [Cephalotus follicularis]
PFKDYYADWFNTLKTTLLPLLHQSLSNSSPTLLSSHVDLLLQHFLSYYDTLDVSASHDTISDLLFPSWRNSLEKPFLFLGDLHPYLFTNLLRRFLDIESDEEDNENDGFEQLGGDQNASFFRQWQVVMAWKDPSKNLMTRIEQIECGLRLMVPALVARLREVQADFVKMVAEDWVKCEGKKENFGVGEAMKVDMEEVVSVFVDANRLRRSVISEVVSELSVYQAALFLEGLAQFLVGFRDKELLRRFNRCRS